MFYLRFEFKLQFHFRDFSIEVLATGKWQSTIFNSSNNVNTSYWIKNQQFLLNLFIKRVYINLYKEWLVDFIEDIVFRYNQVSQIMLAIFFTIDFLHFISVFIPSLHKKLYLPSPGISCKAPKQDTIYYLSKVRNKNFSIISKHGISC